MPTTRLRSHPVGFTIWCIIAAFGAYFCMYGFRKPFTAGTYELSLWGIGYKTVLVIAQVLGYTLSKFIGIKVIAEMPAHRRAIGILMLIGLSHLALLGFGIVPAPYNFVFLFLNGLPLGMVFGLVLGFLEGRRLTEALTAGLCASFILADGVTKSVGSYLLEQGIPEMWMPFAAGSVFALPLLVFVWMLTRIPPPTTEDVLHRSERTTMNAAERWSLFRRYAPGLTLLVLVYLFITVLRSVRADFAPEIWRGLGYDNTPSLFTISETYVMLGVVFLNGLAFLIGNNRIAFHTAMGTAMLGLVLSIIAVSGLNSGRLDGFSFMVMIGLGLYLPYVAVHTTIFERLIAMTREKGNLGYLMYLADAFGYLGYVAVMLVKNFARPEGEFLSFFTMICWFAATLSVGLLLLSWGYFTTRRRTMAPHLHTTPHAER